MNKKIFLLFLSALMGVGSLLAQTSVVSGVWERNTPKSVKMFKVVNGSLAEVASSALSGEGSFSMQFTSGQEGYYVLGTSTRPIDRYVFYLKPGDSLNVRVTKDSYQLLGEENTPENKEMARWHDFIFPLEDKAVYFVGKNSTYVDFFPLMEEKLTALKSYKAKKTKNKKFNASFADYREYDLLYTAIQFIFSVRSAHPKDEDFIDYYRKIDVPALSSTTKLLDYPDGLRTLLNAYMLHSRLSGMPAQDYSNLMNNPANALLKANPDAIKNDTIKGEIVLMFGHFSRTAAGMKEYKRQYGDFLVTDGQRERWKQIEDSYQEPAEKDKHPIDFTFQDSEGNNVSLSDFRGKVVYIDIWATWCGPCKREMPSLKELEKEYKDIVFMGINVDVSKNIQKWKDFLVSEQLPGVQLFAGDMAGEALSKPYKIKGIPRFMLVGKDGCLIYMDAPRPSSSEIRIVLDDALKTSSEKK